MAVFLARSAVKQLIASTKSFPSVLTSSNLSSKVTFENYVAPSSEEHDTRNARLSRPMSPHLTIYAPQLTSMLSITHRGTGMMLSGYFMALGIGALALPYDVNHYVTMIEGLQLSSATIFLAKFILAAPLGYHAANGVRHLWWDTAHGLTIKQVYASGYAMLGLAAVLTFILAAM